MLKRIINKILFYIYGEDVLITKEGWSYLNDPVKRVKLREWIELYHKTGVWDYSFWYEPKHEELNQSDVSKIERSLPFDFVIWYSGMKEEQISNAYKRYLNEVKR